MSAELLGILALALVYAAWFCYDVRNDHKIADAPLVEAVEEFK